MSRCYICLTTPLVHQWQKVTSSDLPCCLCYLGSYERFSQKYEETLSSGSVMAERSPTAAWVLFAREKIPTFWVGFPVLSRPWLVQNSAVLMPFFEALLLRGNDKGVMITRVMINRTKISLSWRFSVAEIKDWERNDLKKRGGEETLGDIPMNKKE